LYINIAIQSYYFKPSQLDDGLDESPTVTVEEDNKLGKNRGILKPRWAFVKTHKVQYGSIQVTTLNRQQEATKWHIKACGVWERKVKILRNNQNCAWI
jgi:hypothetical protein